MFQTIDRSGLKRLERFSVPQAILARLPSMAPYDYVVHGTGGASPSHP
jgi:hypothetical protein